MDRKSALLWCLVALNVIAIGEPRTVPDFWYSSQFSPLSFEFPRLGRSVEESDVVLIRTLSPGITGYDLGCVAPETGKEVKTVRMYDLRTPVEKQEMPVKVLGMLSNQCRGTKLAITRVRFADSSFWSMPKAKK